MTLNLELLEELSSISNEGIEEDLHPYERASEERRSAFDRDIEGLARRYEAREREGSIRD